MKYLLIMLCVSFAAVIAPLPAFVQIHKGAEHAMAEENELIEVGNKICPVSGEKIVESEAVKVEYEGKIYNLCCKICAKDFKKDPEKYIKKIEELKGSHME